MKDFNKYAWVVPLKDKKVLQLLMLFKKCLSQKSLSLGPKDASQTKYGTLQ